MYRIDITITYGGRRNKAKKHSMQARIKMHAEEIGINMIPRQVQHAVAEADFHKIDKNTDQ